MDFETSLGLQPSTGNIGVDLNKIIPYINLKLASLGQPIYERSADSDFLEIARPLLKDHQELSRQLAGYLCPADQRVQAFLDDYFKGLPDAPALRLPSNTFTLDRHGLARTLSLPQDHDEFFSEIINSYRVRQGVLHNPKNDRRTTKGAFHIAEGGLPIPYDKRAVPRAVFAKLLRAALNPPQKLLELPFTSTQERKARLFVSLLLRPVVSPEVPGRFPEKSMEIRFFAPGGLVCNLDFVESIFGNAGDPNLPEHDAALDINHWTGHSGCVILAPHLVHLKKRDLGLPHYNDATDRQRRDGMCWTEEDECYNDRQAFKATCRDARGVMVTIIADNYFGYCKKEVKTQISFSSNLFGLSEEEHAGGAIAFPSYDLGEEFHLDERLPQNNSTFDDIIKGYGDFMEIMPGGYGIDTTDSSIVYVPEDAQFNLTTQSIVWKRKDSTQRLKLMPHHTYVLPSGYKIHMEKQLNGSYWTLVGTSAEGTLCHKPCTVSGGGKSEISKSIADAIIQGPLFTADFYKDLEMVSDIMQRDFSDRFRHSPAPKRPSRPILSPRRSLGSVIKLFTPSPEFTDAYNQWVESLPHRIKDMIFVIKRHYRTEWGDNWKEYFGVDTVNGHLGHELKYKDRKIIAHYLRVGQELDGTWRIYRLRQDFHPANKVQAEDDITASIVVPSSQLAYLNGEYRNPSVKLVKNCEYRLFQRPDDAIHRGYDKQAELDLSSPNSFLSNFEPLHRWQARELMEDSIGFDQYTSPVRKLIRGFLKENSPTYVVCSSQPRVIDGQPSKNPRYLQNRPDLMDPRSAYLAAVGTRLFRKVPADHPVYLPVNAVLPGRRNNPPDPEAGIPPLAVYNPIHYQELPELFMDFICSVTGKSPSTTGFGSEGALTKGPFNALWSTVDLNNALVSYILTGYEGFSSAAGYIGPKYRVDHDISLLIPEIWCRMSVDERDPHHLIREGYLEPVKDVDYEGRVIPASRLGYRITMKFVHAFLGRIFSDPHAVFTEDMLQPERQDLAVFVDGVENIVATQQRVAQHHLDDGSIDAACPPLRALLHIMAFGQYDGKDVTHPEIRRMFTRDSLIQSDWYRERLATKQSQDIDLWTRHVKYLARYLRKNSNSEPIARLGIRDRYKRAVNHLKYLKTPEYLDKLQGTIGADPFVARSADARRQALYEPVEASS